MAWVQGYRHRANLVFKLRITYHAIKPNRAYSADFFTST